MLDHIGLIKKSVQGVKDRLAEIQTQAAELQRRRNAILSAPAAKSDVVAILTQRIEAAGAAFAPSLQGYLADHIRQPTRNGVPQESLLSLVRVDRLTGDASSSQVEAVLCACFGEQLKAAFARAIDTMEWPADAGLPIAQRTTEVAKLDEQLEALYREESELREQAGNVGLIV